MSIEHECLRFHICKIAARIFSSSSCAQNSLKSDLIFHFLLPLSFTFALSFPFAVHQLTEGEKEENCGRFEGLAKAMTSEEIVSLKTEVIENGKKLEES